jgi:hypothetical protein
MLCLKELGLRIQQLKSEGATGKALKEFASDPEVKKMVASLDGFMASLEKELKRITALHAKDFKSLLPRYKTLSKELQDEIASRKKQVSTKIGTGNKSLADMQKLHAELAKYGDDHELMAVVGFLPEEIAGHRKQLNRQIQDQIDKTHDAVLTALQAEMDEQALEGRNRKRNVSRAKGLAEQVLAECAKAQKALAERNNTELMRVKATVGKPMKELDELWSKYDRGLKDGWVRSKITESKDRAGSGQAPGCGSVTTVPGRRSVQVVA